MRGDVALLFRFGGGSTAEAAGEGEGAVEVVEATAGGQVVQVVVQDVHWGGASLACATGAGAGAVRVSVPTTAGSIKGGSGLKLGSKLVC